MSKRMKLIQEKKTSVNTLDQAINLVKECATAKFDESIDVVYKLGINPRHAEENVRGSVILPHGKEKKVKIVAFVTGSDIDLAKNAGATYVGGEELIQDIKSGKINDFDLCVATPDLVSKIAASLAKMLGQRGILPNVKDGTVTKEIVKIIEEIKSGKKQNYRNDKNGYLQISIGRASFSTEKLVENFKEITSTVLAAKAPKVKEMIKRITISSTMGIGCDVPLKAAI